MSLLSSLKTNTFTVTVEHNVPTVRTYAARLDGGVLHILVPEHIALDDRHFLQTVLPEMIKHFLKSEAKRVLPVRLRALSEQCGLAFNRVTVKDMRSRWGSCSSRRDIALSIYLMLLPDELMDAVLIHELCHLREMNHGAGFKSLLNGYVPDIAEKNRRIKGYAPLIRLFV